MNIALDQSQVAPSVEALERHISRASKALLAGQHEDGHWCFELEADATIPAEYVLLRHFRGEKPDLELERLIAVYLRRIQGDHGGWPLVHAGPFDMSASVKAYFALKMIGDDTRRAVHGPCARSHSRPWRGGEEQRLHALPAGALWRHSLAWRSDHASRDHAPAALVSLSSRQGLLLGAHGDGPAAGPAGAEATPRQSARRHDRRAVRCPAGDGARMAQGRASGVARGQALRRDRLAAQARRAFLSSVVAPPRNCRRRGFRDRAPQRRGRSRRDLSSDGERRADVRRTRLSARPSAFRRRAPVDREAAGRRRGRSLLPALPVARVGHRARGPRADGSQATRRARRPLERASNGLRRCRCST